MPTDLQSAQQTWGRRIELNPDTGCWVWTGYVGWQGYGWFSHAGRLFRAHRLVYEWSAGPIPDGLVIDHLCHNSDESCPGGTTCPHRRCVNPAHLKPVTQAENALSSGRSLSALKAKQTHCIHGHELSGDNVCITGHKRRAQRQCLACKREARKRQKLKREGGA